MKTLASRIEGKRKEIQKRKRSQPVKELVESHYFKRASISLTGSLKASGSTAIIAEYRRRKEHRPLPGGFNSVQQVTRFYSAFGASALLIATDSWEAGGSTDDLIQALGYDLPVIRYDLVIDEYQLYEAKSFGADAIVLNADILEEEELQQYSELAHSIGMEVICQASEKKDQALFVQNVNAFLFPVSKMESSYGFSLSNHLMIAEGFSSEEEMKEWLKKGGRALVTGSVFMKEENPGEAFKEFMYSL